MAPEFIEETPAREVARLFQRLRQILKEGGKDDQPLGDLWTDVLRFPDDDALLRLEILLGFSECCQYSIYALGSLKNLEDDDREEAILGMRKALKLLNPVSFSVTKAKDAAKIILEEGLPARLLLAAQLCREPIDEDKGLQESKLAEADSIIENCSDLHKRTDLDNELKQIIYDFQRTARHVIKNMDLLGRVGMNKVINRTVDKLVNWRHFNQSEKRVDREAMAGLVFIISKVISSLHLKGHKGFSLATLVLINAVDPLEDDAAVHLGMSTIHPALAGILTDIDSIPRD